MSGRRPLVGITCGGLAGSGPPRYSANQAYVRALQQAGADAILLPPGTDVSVLERLDGLLLPGGPDLHPAFYGEAVDGSEEPFDTARDEMELAMVRAAVGRMPVLAICRGIQVANVALGGSLIQDLPGHRQEGARSDLAHAMTVAPASRLRDVVGADQVEVNTLHHQAVDRVAPGLIVTAHAPDGTIEALESEDGTLLAVQCHPEELTRLEWVRALFSDLAVRAGRPAAAPAPVRT